MPSLPGAHRAENVSGSIKSPATNLTIGSALIGLVPFVLTFWDQAFEAVFGPDASEATRRWIVLGLIAAYTVIAAADLIARAIAAAAHDSAWGQVAGAAVGQTGVEGVFPAQRSTKTAGQDEPGFVAVAKRTKSGQKQLLLVKSDAEPAWVNADDVSFDSVS